MTPPTFASRLPLASPRTLAAWALLGFVALFLFFELVRLILPGGSLSGRAAGADFRSLIVMAMPVLAVLLTRYVSAPLPGAALISLIAVIEYGVALVFGLITLLIGLPAVLDGINNAQSGLAAFRYVVMGLAALVLIAIAGYVALRTMSGRTVGSPLNLR